MIVPDYRNFRHSSELYHYGMPRRSGRYPYGSGDRPYQDKERAEKKITKRFDKLDKVIEKNQTLANKKYAKAIRKSTRKFQTDFSISSAKKSFRKATAAQKKANIAIYKGSKYFKKYEKMIGDLNLEMNEEIKNRGMDYLNKVVFNPNSAYQVALLKKV